MTDVSSLSARESIRDLYARYCFALDYGTTTDLLDCFTPEGVFSLSDRGDFQGHEQIGTIIDASAQSRNRHMIMNLLFDELTTDRARCRAYFLLIRTRDAAVMSYGHYVDDVVLCADGVWRWSRKGVNFDWREEAYATRSQAQTVDKLIGAGS